ncbi:MAG TPA: iron-containing redox enzyme family protein [Pyrinomonadaceae bacterium]
MIRSLVESEFAGQTEAFAASAAFQSLKSGRAQKQDYDHLIEGLCRTHLKSPQILAFLYSMSPPRAARSLKHNMLEELGLDGEAVAHPQLLLKLAEASGFEQETLERLEAESQDELRQMCTDPILFGSFKEFGLVVLLEVTCFEWMLSRLAQSMAGFLSKHRGLTGEALEWFLHHSEVDQRHAEEGLDAVVDYVAYYDFEMDDLRSLLEITFRENVFLKRYFGESLPSRHALVSSL